MYVFIDKDSQKTFLSVFYGLFYFLFLVGLYSSLLNINISERNYELYYVRTSTVTYVGEGGYDHALYVVRLYIPEDYQQLSLSQWSHVLLLLFSFFQFYLPLLKYKTQSFVKIFIKNIIFFVYPKGLELFYFIYYRAFFFLKK